MLENKIYDINLKEAKDVFKAFIDKNSITSVNKDFLDLMIEKTIATCTEYVNRIIDLTNANYEIIELKDLDLVIDDEVVTIRANDSICVSQEGNVRTYFELKKFKDKDLIKEYLKLYIESLIDIASFKNNERYEIRLKRTNEYHMAFIITKCEAQKKLKDIYIAMFNSKYNKYFYCDLINEKELSYDKFMTEYYHKELSKYGKVWNYYKDKKIFNDDMSGYSKDDFEIEYDIMMKLMKELIIYEKEDEGGKKDA